MNTFLYAFIKKLGHSSSAEVKIKRILALSLFFIFTFNIAQISAQSTTFSAGAYIIDMGQEPQTIKNGLKPYGLVYDLILNNSVPVSWAINPSKNKDGIDFTVNGKDFKGGSFIIASEYINDDVLSTINTWQYKGVIIEFVDESFDAPIFHKLSSWPRAVLDLENGYIVENYYNNAEIPTSSYVTAGNPTLISDCEDIYVLPHAEPDDWDQTYIDALKSFIENDKGYLWAACHAVSQLENLAGCNFLSVDGLIHWQDHLSDWGENIPYDYAHSGDPVMQFMGSLDEATNKGSERVYLPISGWNSTSSKAVYDSDHDNYPNTATAVVYGRAFGNPYFGRVMYESGHDHDDDYWNGSSNRIEVPESAKVAAQRAYFNFVLLTGIEKEIDVSVVAPEPVDIENSIEISANAAGGVAPYIFNWTSKSGGSLSQQINSGTLSTITYTPPASIDITQDVITVKVTDDCSTGRFSILSIPIPIIQSNQTDAPTGTTPQTFCEGAIVSDLIASGTSIQWYSAASGGSPLASTDILTDNTVYYASQTVSGVESVDRLAVTVYINYVTGGTIAEDQVACLFSNPDPFTEVILATGSGSLTYEWYFSATDTSPGSFAMLTGPGTTDPTYQPFLVSSYHYFKRITISTLNGVSCSAESNILTISQDTEAPVWLDYVEDIILECGEDLTIVEPTATDNQGTTTVSYSDETVTLTGNAYTIIRTWTAVDLCGNVVDSDQIQNIIINDLTPPVPDIDPLADVTAECSVPTLTEPTATDNCDGTITVTNNATFPITETTVVTWTYVDGNGNINTQNQNVIINDNTDPVPDNATLPDLIGECEVLEPLPPTATDNCVGPINGTPDTSFPIRGTTVVTWTYDDGNGNIITQEQNVIINDITAPVPDVPTLGDLTGECSVASPTPPTATDNCQGTINGTHSPNFPITTQGTTIITWTYVDGNGNTSTQEQNVIIEDITPPVIPTLADITGQCSATATAPTTTDACSGTITGTTTDPLTYSTQGTYIITWDFDDGNGNISTQTQNIIIDDTTPPVAPVIADVNGECTATAVAPTTTDVCSGTITGTTTDPLTYSEQGTYIITWNFADNNGNSIDVNQNVIIDDVTPPVPDLDPLADLTGECEVSAPEPPTATDNCTGPITGTTTATFPITETAEIIWTYDDGNGNINTQFQNVVIEDITPPVPDLPDLNDLLGECSVSAPTAPTATDNCAGTITGTTVTTFPVAGTTVIVWIYDDENGNIITQEQNVIINDKTAPVPDVPTLGDITDECSVSAPTTPTATDNCDGPIQGTTTTEFPITTQGTTIVIWTYTDGNENTVTQEQNVIIDDTTDPVPDVPTLNNLIGECSVSAPSGPTATDNCIGTLTGTTITEFPITTQGTTIVTWIYDDGNGNVITQDQNVIIDDITSPIPGLETLADITGECSVSAPSAPTATDNCIGIVTGTTTTEFPITNQGTTVITWIYDDGEGNTITQTQNVIIDDITSPVPDLETLANLTGECSVSAPSAPTATDNCIGIVTGTTTTEFPITNQGTTVITWIYDDENGNTSTQSQNVIIDDITAPVPDLSTLADLTAECSVSEPLAPTATDNCAGLITGTTISEFPITGTTVIVWIYDDGNENIITQEQNVIITDITPPVPDIETLADITDECSVSDPDIPTATDSCAGTIFGTTITEFPITGTTVITWTYIDGNGNISTQNQNVIIDDITSPVPDLATLADITGECSVSELITPTATDNCEGPINGTTTTEFPITTQGTTIVTWSYVDGNGNTSTQNQNVIIDDTTIPVPDLATLTDITAECSVSEPLAPTATDNCEGAVIGTTITEFPVTTQGTTIITWTFDDGNGNSTTQNQNIIIEDITPPVPDLLTLADATGECSVSEPTAPTATDNCTGIITGTTSAVFPITTQGITVITWTYDDGNGNLSTQNQNIINDDITPPSPDFATLDDLIGDCFVSEPIAPTAIDICEGTITGTTTTIFPITGSTTIIWTYADGNGNSSTQTQNVIILDNIPPVPDAATLSDLTDECSVSEPEAPTATDDCAGTITGTTTTEFPVSGSTVIEWIFVDDNANISTQNQNIFIDDTTPPVPDINTLNNLTDECSVSILVAPTATDNCEGAITGTTTTEFPITTQGTTIVTWSYVDGNGNTTTQNQTVIIDDITPPVTITQTDLTDECSVSEPMAPTAEDNCAGTISGTTTTVFPITTQGLTVVTWTYDDGNGNISTQNQNIIIDDITLPVPDLTTLEDLLGDCRVDEPAHPTATDNCTGTITGTTTTSFPVTGTTVIIWSFNDGNGNIITQNQNVIIDDQTPPVPDAVILADLTDECYVPEPAAPTAYDDCEGSITGTTTTEFPVTAQGTTIITWTFVDGNGNTSTQNQNIILNDITPPTASNPSDLHLQCIEEAIFDPEAVTDKSDNCSNPLLVEFVNDVSDGLSCPETISRTYRISDAGGNYVEVIQNIIVNDITAPTASDPLPIFVECLVDVPNPNINVVFDASDNCISSLNIEFLSEESDSLPLVRTITRIYSVADNCGNTIYLTQNIFINGLPHPEDDYYTIDENSHNNIFTVLDNDDFGCDGPGESGIEIVSPPMQGEITINDNNSPLDPSDDYLQYTPSRNYFLDDSFEYTITDLDGDRSSAWVYINFTPNPLFIPEGFSPNGDGINDVFYIRGLSYYPQHSIIIFDKKGKYVFEAEPYLNDWDGKDMYDVNQPLLPQDTYFYILDLGNGSAKIKGFVYLIRKY